MKISELKVKKIIHRPTRQFDEYGKRIYNEFEYDLPYKTIYKNNERDRLFAKIIDLIPFFLIFLFIFKEPAIISLVFSIPCVIISGTMTETLCGTTSGKKIFKIRVIDDFGNYPACTLCQITALVRFNPPLRENSHQRSQLARLLTIH